MLTAAISCVYQTVGLVGKEITICQVLLKEFPRLRVVEDLQGQFFLFSKTRGSISLLSYENSCCTYTSVN